MSEKLNDPSKAAHEIVRTLDGHATRNDEIPLEPAGNNPWYVLATIHGEYQGNTPELSLESPLHRDHELHVKNRRAWNGWFCQNLTDEEISQLVKKFSLDEKVVCRLTDAELDEIKHNFLERMIRMLRGRKLPERHYVLIDEAMPELGEAWKAEYFNKLIFSKPIYFDGFLFDDGVTFDYSVFKDQASFSKALFFSGASFGNTHFAGSVDFSRCEFVKDPQLKTEDAQANFVQATFSDEVDFGRAKFGDEAAFRFAQFSRKAIFTKAEFKNYAAFRSSIFLEDAIFRGVQFGGFVNFASASFKSITRFDDASFQECVPEFYGASIFENATFPCSSDNEKNWPQLSGKTAKQVEQQKRAYNRLRLFMNRSLQIDEEQFFHRIEMRCKAVLAKWYHKPLYWLFATFSDYGNSVWRPVAWGALSVVAVTVFMLWWQGVFAFMPQEAGMDWTFGLLADGDVWAKPREAFGWSISNTLPFIGTGKLYYGGEFAAELAWPLRVVGGVQTLFGFVLLFLFGLGLRNRFRLR